ncbi:MAG: enolase C-terminal domain-like protein [Candidatus Komeilibacteria bacterium]|nr:enolase C-terminal domain-like protein [Candidatus Komeilibacteria bacterium]
MIKKVILTKQTLHFREPFKIAYEEATEDKQLFLQLVDARGRVGFGSASFDQEVSHENADEMYKILRQKLRPDFFDQPIEQWYYYHEKIAQVFGSWPAAQAMIETAVLHLWSAGRNVSLWEFFGARQKQRPLCFTVGIKSLPQTLAAVKARLKEGYKIIKLKGGLDWSQDAEKVAAVSNFLPQGVKLLFDANQGYSFIQAQNFLKKTKKTKLALLEQPVSAKNLAGLKKLHRSTALPIIADEAAVSLADCQKLLLGDYVSGVNVKLMKCGGPVNFLSIYHLAKALNKIIMIGCMYESLASLTISGQLALSLKVDYADLDSGPIDFYDDPAQGGLAFKSGQLCLAGPVKLKLK